MGGDGYELLVEALNAAAGSGRRGFLRGVEHFIDRRGKFVETGARNNNGVSAPVGLLYDFQETSAIIFPKFNQEMLAFHL
jgi:hypothetical protein